MTRRLLVFAALGAVLAAMIVAAAQSSAAKSTQASRAELGGIKMLCFQRTTLNKKCRKQDTMLSIVAYDKRPNAPFPKAVRVVYSGHMVLTIPDTAWIGDRRGTGEQIGKRLKVKVIMEFSDKSVAVWRVFPKVQRDPQSGQD